MNLFVVLAGLVTVFGFVADAQAPENNDDVLAFSCLSESTGLFVLGLAAGRESPNETAAHNAARIGESCRVARLGLEQSGHVCLEMIGNSERMAEGLSRVYAGRLSVADFAASGGTDPSLSHDEGAEVEANEICEARMSELTQKTATGEDQ